MLGLGDIVIPGLFVAMILRFDWRNSRNESDEEIKMPYFKTVSKLELSRHHLTLNRW